MQPSLILILAGVISAFKILLLQTYKSTDFDVHRNWLAVTYSRPISQWYYEATSEWTLDYPPFFAYFEYALAHIGKYVDVNMLVISKEAYTSASTVLFQRLTVVITDMLYVYAAYRLSADTVKSPVAVNTENWRSHPGFVLTILLLTNSGLWIEDHIHFQYNGFLFGILLLSVVNMLTGRVLWSTFWFTCLLCFKHIFLYMAPAYFVYILRSYCFTKSNPDGGVQWRSLSIRRLVLLALVKLPVYALAFGPFIYMGQMRQVLNRLFPFKRGLSHAYWAPNFWALYNFGDKVLSNLGARLGLIGPGAGSATMTGGLVQEAQHLVLPSITPPVTMAFTLAAMLPCLYRMWKRPSGGRGFLRCLTLCAYCSYMFGWHVHEKAILMVIIPLTISSVFTFKDAQLLQLLSPIGHFSLFPLIYTTKEIPIVLCLFLIHTTLTFACLGTLYRSKSYFQSLLTTVELLYLVGALPVYVYWMFLHQYLGLADRLAFLPLLVISVYSAAGITYGWLKYYALCLNTSTTSKSKPNASTTSKSNASTTAKPNASTTSKPNASTTSKPNASATSKYTTSFKSTKKTTPTSKSVTSMKKES